MKSLSSAIVAAAGVLCFAAGGFIAHDDTQVFVMLVGTIVGLLGLVAWGLSIFRPADPPAEDMTASREFQFGLGSLFVLFAILAVLLAIPAAQERREHERRVEATRKLKQIGNQFRSANRSQD